MDAVICNGAVITPAGVRMADVGIEGEMIAAVAPGLSGGETFDATGCFVLPGGIDPHVHLQMPQRQYVSADDFRTGTVAAACGGTTTVIDFVEPRPGEPLSDALARRRAEADGAVAVDYGLHMTIPAWHAARRETLDALPDLVAEGVSSFKLYLAYEGLRLDDGQLYHALRHIGDAGGLPIVHCENGPVCEVLRAEALASEQTTPIFHARTRPPRQEAEATGRLIDIAALARCPVYVVHVSCRESLDRIKRARARGEPVSAETCPQYLVLDESALGKAGGERLICAPPLRHRSQQQALWAALAAGDIDVLATDHCPFTSTDKSGHDDFTTVPGGIPSIEVRVALARAAGRHHGITPSRWAQVCAENASRIFGLGRKGRVEPGFDADIVIFDTARLVELAAGRTLHENVDWSPYQGMRVEGWARDVFSRGRVVVRDGEFVGEAGWGRFVKRERT
jgi:dihydropyrimidinase